MSITEILAEVDRLPLVEREQVLKALQKAKIAPNANETRAALHRRLIAEGRLKAVPPREDLPRIFEPIQISGKPLSETIIEERG